MPDPQEPHGPLSEAGRGIKGATVGNLASPRLDTPGQRAQLDLLQAMNRESATTPPHDARLEAVIQSHELAFRMQGELPRLLDLAGESAATLQAYGIGAGAMDDFGRQCLLARRLAEAGVRFIEVTHEDWDHHGFVSANMPQRCAEIDRPIAALLADLTQRGLLEETLVVWGGEFGRTPDDPTQDGRGHGGRDYRLTDVHGRVIREVLA